MLTQDEVRTIAGATVVDAEGDRVGSVGRVYVDDATGEPAWLTVRTGLFGHQESFVPLAGASVAGDEVRLAHTTAQVEEAPRVDVDAHLTLDEERRLYAHYGLEDGARAGAGAGTGTGATTAPAVAAAGSGMGTEAGTDLGDAELHGHHHDHDHAGHDHAHDHAEGDLTGRGLSGTVAGDASAYGGDPRPAAAGPGPSDTDGGDHAGSTHRAPTSGDGTAGPAGGTGTAPVAGYDLGEADRGEAGRGSSDPGPATTDVRHATAGADTTDGVGDAGDGHTLRADQDSSGWSTGTVRQDDGGLTDGDGLRPTTSAWDEGRSRMRPWTPPTA